MPHLLSIGTQSRRNLEPSGQSLNPNHIPASYSTVKDSGLDKQTDMGHDICSMGVCLLEIGLWKLPVQVRGKVSVPGRLAKRAGVSTDETAGDAGVIKTGLIEMVEADLPKTMSYGYAKLVVACLTCLDVSAEETWGRDSGPLTGRPMLRLSGKWYSVLRTCVPLKG